MRIALTIISVCAFIGTSFAGNPDRAGSNGANQLLINPWTRTLGLQGSNVASSLGSEAIFTNVAGMALVNKTDLQFSTTDYFKGADISMLALGFAQKLGESSVLGINVTTLDFGDNDITTTDNPDGGIGTFSPNMTNIGISYAKTFSNSIYGGFTLRYFQESIPNVGGSGLAFDAGIRYITGPRDNVRIGISLRNVGPGYTYGGDGTSIIATDDAENQRSFFERTAGAELPALISIGGAYDFQLAEKHKLTVNGAFISNSFQTDEFAFGLEYDFNERFAVRGSYQTERRTEEVTEATNAKSGIAAGASINVPINKDGGVLSINYGYLVTNPFDGIQSIGIGITL